MLEGQYYNGNDSQPVTAQLYIDSEGKVSCREVNLSPCPLAEIKVSARVGNTPRHLYFPDGSSFESRDNDTVDRWLKQYRHRSRFGLLLHLLESRFRYLLTGFLLLLALVSAFFIWGLPWLSQKAADATPVEVATVMSEQTLRQLDHVLEPTELPPLRQEQLKALFNQLKPANTPFRLQLEFRNGGPLGANAMALPDGTIIMTDQLLELAQNDQEIAAVMLHEIGHIIYRHGLQSAYNHAGFGVLYLALSGDASSTLMVVIPALLVETGYSRDMERQADRYALDKMQELNLDPEHLLAFLSRLELQAMLDSDNKGGVKKSETAQSKEPPSFPQWFEYISSHPLGESRLKPLRQQLEPPSTEKN